MSLLRTQLEVSLNLAQVPLSGIGPEHHTVKLSLLSTRAAEASAVAARISVKYCILMTGCFVLLLFFFFFLIG